MGKGLKHQKLLSLKEIEGPVATHDGFLKHELARRKEALELVDDAARLAEYIGGRLEPIGRGESWSIAKEVFPGIEILFVFQHGDDEFPANLRVLFFGDRIENTRGEDLADLAVACVNHMLRYVRETVQEPPQICLIV
ncbi:MAG: hypothetical protein DRI39_03255 [Chloroflexi bacterium]|nr:MAG: hypothetical protein DRI39_03255 [Chloroflexota bacterium]RLC97253.1 MAG: hypothetical protein DRI40_00720 [Chloroflexota bacterium]